jgi:REP element-mobilizing transposase RayT
MARPLRTEFPGAIYHVMSRGNARQVVFRDDRDYQRMVDGLAQTVDRFGWQLLSFVLMPNHLHLFLRTPRPNLSRGMQYLVSGYANWHAKRHRRPGHLFQGRFKSELIEDEGYFWTVSRYVHLNPTRGKVPLAAHPRDWPWSSYRGYAQRRHRVRWIAYDVMYAAWRGEVGGSDPEAAYRRFVEAGLAEPPQNPLRPAVHGWLVGSEEFVDRMRSQVQLPRHQDEMPTSRRLAALDSKTVITAAAEYYGVASDQFRMRRSRELSRDVAAWRCRHLATCTLRDLAPVFGVNHPDSVRNLVRRVDRALTRSSSVRRDVATLRDRLLKTENRV